MSKINESEAIARVKSLNEETYARFVAANGIADAPSLKDFKSAVDQYASQRADDNGRLGIQADSIKAGGFWGNIGKGFVSCWESCRNGLWDY